MVHTRKRKQVKRGRSKKNNKAGAGPSRQEMIDLFDDIKKMAEQGRQAIIAGMPHRQIQRVGSRKSPKKTARKSPQKPARKSPQKPARKLLQKPARKSPKKTTRKLIQKQEGPYRPVSPRSQAKLSSWLKRIQQKGHTDMPMQKPARQLLQKPDVGPIVGPSMSGESNSFALDGSPKVATPGSSNVVKMGRFIVEDGDESPTPDFTPGSPVSDYSMSDSSVSGSPSPENKD